MTPVDDAWQEPNWLRWTHPVECPAEKTFDDLDGFKQILLKKKDQFARALTEKVMIYALGRGMEYTDEVAIESMAERDGEEWLQDARVDFVRNYEQSFPEQIESNSSLRTKEPLKMANIIWTKLVDESSSRAERRSHLFGIAAAGRDGPHVN